jgi:hypothetical protein
MIFVRTASDRLRSWRLFRIPGGGWDEQRCRGNQERPIGAGVGSRKSVVGSRYRSLAGRSLSLVGILCTWLTFREMSGLDNIKHPITLRPAIRIHNDN